MSSSPSRRKPANATRESVESIGIRQFAYRAVSLGDATIDETDRYRTCYLQQQRDAGGPCALWPDSQPYQAWFHSLAAWRQIMVLARAIERGPLPDA